MKYKSIIIIIFIILVLIGLYVLTKLKNIGTKCSAGEILCNSQCINIQSNTNNCGACGKACPTGYICSNGSCVQCIKNSDCTGGQLCCNNNCVDPYNNLNNCGGCGNICPTTMICSAEDCVCPNGTILCKGVCSSSCSTVTLSNIEVFDQNNNELTITQSGTNNTGFNPYITTYTIIPNTTSKQIYFIVTYIPPSGTSTSNIFMSNYGITCNPECGSYSYAIAANNTNPSTSQTANQPISGYKSIMVGISSVGLLYTFNI
jgi:hypothetical protein